MKVKPRYPAIGKAGPFTLTNDRIAVQPSVEQDYKLRRQLAREIAALLNAEHGRQKKGRKR